ncbi:MULTISPECIES: thermonuclease family protein [Chryseobacterium]|uniref:Micrococcal nuclease n=1 Tax=Chryseobacterium camelliae TaxID=1265445 RepID=A0ABU0TL13_9FLAO|nr:MULTISPECIES: thermonuclease family protein [Chryseobacterium]MDT3408415.1 micrococcal nuclease [Pseudacidovorax intermedius]MDQ1097729.1 micrococcal nuclease [Chryseobacterium camelliae]MDQ1101661.1 micrococcal nuclease [Chryseobacterium sp. SORGH_AS_1048]MDR6085101.1 micrococcal nuclease [Chryseobacterium sp. SORGH_AS_0909]MDR6129456.1 micrococcal nuclease [Chryseobacterium sp. SORGH_AS_1175]
MKTMISAVALLMCILVGSQTRGKVIKIKDGDTVVVLLSDNTQQTLRLAEVDCPEDSQAFGKAAKQFTAGQVFGKTVTFYQVGKDRYGRGVAGVFYDNDKYLSREIVRAGFGWWYFKASKNTELRKLQDEAKLKKLGIWADKNAVSPWEFRKAKKTKKKNTTDKAKK